MYLKDIGHQVVGSFADASVAISRTEDLLPDIALIDIHLPGSIDGIEAADILQKQFGIPVVFISSYTDESTVQKAISTHSYGYLVKPIDKTALKITIDLVYEKNAFEKTHLIHQHLIENLEMAIIGLSLTLKITFWNNGATQLFGVDNQLALGKDLTFLIPGLTEEQIQIQIIEPTLSHGQHSIRIEIPDNNYKPTPFNLHFYLNKSQNDIFGLICHILPIGQEDKSSIFNYPSAFYSLFNNIPKSLLILDNSLNIIRFNQFSNKFTQRLLKKEIQPQTHFLEVFDFFEKQETTKLLINSFDGVTHYLERCIVIDNKPVFLEIIIFPIYNKHTDKDNTINNICISVKDISDIKQLEKELEETRNEIKPLFDSSIQRFYLCDLNYGLVSFNKSAKDIIIKEFNRVLRKGDNILDFLPGDIEKEDFAKKYEEAKKGNNITFKNQVNVFETSYWLESHIDPILNEKGEIYRILVWTMDVSEREQNLQDLKETQDRYTLVASGGNDGIWDWDIPNNSVYLSPRWKSLLGYEDHELLNEFGLRDSLTHPDDLKKSQENISNYVSGITQEYQNEIRLRHKNGNYIWVIERGELLKNDDGTPIRLAGSITDISHIKKIETDILLTNEKLLQERNMFIQGNVVIARVLSDDVGRTVFISDNIEPILGYKPSEFYDGSISYDKLIFPEDLEHHKLERLDAVKNNQNNVAYSPYRLIGRDNQVVWVKDFATFIRDEKGEIKEILGYFVDITSEKKWEAALFESQKKYFSLFNEANDSIVIVEESTITDCNSKFEELFGYKKEELVGKDTSILSPDNQPDGSPSQEKRIRKIKGALEDKKNTFYWLYKRKNGETFDSEVSLNSIKIGDKLFLHVAIRDITQRKEIERSLKVSEAKFRHLLDALPDLLFIINKEGVYTYFKPDSKHELAVPENKVVGKNIDEFFSGAPLEEYRNKIHQVLTDHSVQNFRYDLDSPVGIKSFEARISAISKDEVLQIVRIIE
jgi:PAS domain S-box-containing protein